ncbi:MAG: nonstructural protein [Arizlama microvirus]|nr:MAG: nonstructural protein [Arizlama microvirus]
MKIYAIRDRLLDYYMQPFAGPEDKAVLASIARMINTQGEQSDIAQAPHHFEVWELGEIDDEGHINPTRKLIADCSSLVRPNIRERDQRRSAEDSPTAEIGRGTPPSTYPDARAAQRPPQAAPPAAEDETLYASPPPQRPVN